jgi:integrase
VSIYRHPKTQFYFTDFTIGGKRIRQSTGTKDRTLAEQYEATIKQSIWAQRHLKVTPDYTWQSAVVKYLNEKSQKRSLNDDKVILRNLHPHLGDFLLRDINRETADSAIDTLAKERHWSPARCNRHASLIRCILNLAWKEWGWLDKPVALRFQIEERDEPLWVTPAEAKKLLKNVPEHWIAPIAFTLATGLRKGNVLGADSLTWDKIDLDRGIAIVPGSKSKNRHLMRIKLNKDAVKILKSLPHREGHLFLFNGRPFTIGYKHWYRAVNKAGINPELRWHDLRHTWASWHMQAGTHPEELRRLGNWGSMKMVSHYTHLSEQSYDAAADNIAGWQDSATPPKNKTRKKRV